MTCMKSFDGVHMLTAPVGIFTKIRQATSRLIIIKARPIHRIKLFKANNAVTCIEPMI